MEAWLPALLQGQTDAAWDQFLARYRRLIFAAIRHYARDHDDGMDVFAQLCVRLRADDMRRLRVRAEDPAPRAQFSTWLVAVVRNHAIDWIRQRDGRRSRSAAWQQLPELQRRIVELVVLDRVGHAAAFESLRTGAHPGLTYREFQRELRGVYQLIGDGRLGPLVRDAAPPLPDESGDAATDRLERSDRHRALQSALARLDPTDRLAVTLYVLDGLPAAQVAGIMGLPGPKAVYNRVYRVLADLRQDLVRIGIGPGDL
jgi:RNA polymerase sigma factor (sigma-70 family)